MHIARHIKLLMAFWLLGVFFAGLLLAADALQPGGRGIIKIGGVDSLAYFATTHSLLMDHDLDLSNQFAVLKPEFTEWFALQTATGRPGSPFAIGYSLLTLPFLASGRALDMALGHGGDAYGGLAVTFYHLANPVYLGLGLGFLFLFLRGLIAHCGLQAGREDWLAALCCLWLWPATTLSYLTFSPMSHISAFMATCLFLWAWWRAREADRPLPWLGAGLAAGLMIICRWQSALFLVVPLVDEIWGLVSTRSPVRRQRFASWLGSRLLATAGALGVVGLQLWEWKAIYGAYLLIPQGDGFLGFAPRFVAQVLFSTLRGWFVWTPLTLLGVAGLVWGCCRRPRIWLPLLMAAGSQVVVVGALTWNWQQPHSFGSRLLTESLPFVAAGLAALLGILPRPARRVTWSLVALCAAFTMIFAVQYRMDLLPKNDRLTFQELVTDKVFLSRAFHRNRALQEARRDLEAGRGEQATAVLREALTKWGEDRRLLELLNKAEEAAGQSQASAITKSRLEALLARRLF